MFRTIYHSAATRNSLRSRISLFLAGLISVGSPVMAAGPVEIRASDIVLAQPGVLRGTVLNTAAQPVAGISVNVLHGTDVVASATSDEHGQFAVTGLRHGAHEIQVGQTRHPVRFWGNNTAPPVATSQMAIVIDEEIVRGQMMTGDSRIGQMVYDNPLPVLLIGGAVALVLVTSLNDDDDAAAPASP